MFSFIKIQYQLGRINAEQVRQYAALGWITDEEAEAILADTEEAS